MSGRANGEGSIYKRKDGRWCATISLDGGRRKAVYGKTREEAAHKLTKALKAQQDGRSIPGERETVRIYLLRWLEDVARPTVRPGTYDGYERVVRLQLNPEIGTIRLARLGAEDLARCYRRLLATGLSPRSVQLAHAVLHRALRDAERWNLISRNPASLVDAPRPKPPERQPLAPEQIKELLAASEGDRLHALYVVAVSGGLREGELLGLRWTDLDLERGSLSVQQQVQRTRAGWVFSEPKTSKGRRVVTLPRVAVEALKRHRQQQRVERVAAGAAWGDQGLVFANQVGRPIEKQNLIRRSFRPLLMRAGLPPIRFHDLRHSAATLLLHQGVHMKVVQERLGHATIAVTMDTYSHVMPSMQKDASDRLDEFFTGT
jgi:integrase